MVRAGVFLSALRYAHVVQRRLWLAAVAFAGHIPGLKLFTRTRLTPRLVRANIVAVALTLTAMGLAFALWPVGERGLAVLITWLVAHFVWSFVFATWILMGGAVAERNSGDVV